MRVELPHQIARFIDEEIVGREQRADDAAGDRLASALAAAQRERDAQAMARLLHQPGEPRNDPFEDFILAAGDIFANMVKPGRGEVRIVRRLDVIAAKQIEKAVVRLIVPGRRRSEFDTAILPPAWAFEPEIRVTVP